MSISTKSVLSVTEAATEAFQKSQQAYKCGEHQKALYHINKAVTIDPQYYKYYFYRSLCLDALGFYLDALEDAKLSCQIAVDSGTRELKYHVHLASMQMKLDFFGDASVTLNSAMILEGKLNPEWLHKNAIWLRKLDELRRTVNATMKKIDRISAISTEDYHFQYHSQHHSRSDESKSSTPNDSSRSLIRSKSAVSKMTLSSSNDSVTGMSAVTGISATTSKPTYLTRNKATALPPISTKIQKIKTSFPVYDEINWKERRKAKYKKERYIQAFRASFAASRNAAADLISILGSFDAHNCEDVYNGPEDSEIDDYNNSKKLSSDFDHQDLSQISHNQNKSRLAGYYANNKTSEADINVDDIIATDDTDIVISDLMQPRNKSHTQFLSVETSGSKENVDENHCKAKTSSSNGLMQSLASPDDSDAESDVSSQNSGKNSPCGVASQAGTISTPVAVNSEEDRQKKGVQFAVETDADDDFADDDIVLAVSDQLKSTTDSSETKGSESSQSLTTESRTQKDALLTIESGKETASSVPVSTVTSSTVKYGNFAISKEKK